jgi:APA family basic amino acid/polyamine antiporter
MSTTRTQGISLITATAVVVANMIGTGVFTSLGFQVGPLPSGFTS